MAVERLFLIRHGKAEASHPEGDRYRALSHEGRSRIQGMEPPAAQRGFRADLALSSPYRRAVQTRDLFQAVLGAQRLETSPALTPSAEVQLALEELVRWEDEGYRSIAVFTHNPFVTEFANWLLLPGSFPEVEFHTPSILALSFEGGLRPFKGQPLWILHP